MHFSHVWSFWNNWQAWLPLRPCLKHHQWEDFCIPLVLVCYFGRHIRLLPYLQVQRYFIEDGNRQVVSRNLESNQAKQNWHWVIYTSVFKNWILNSSLKVHPTLYIFVKDHHLGFLRSQSESHQEKGARSSIRQHGKKRSHMSKPQLDWSDWWLLGHVPSLKKSASRSNGGEH